MRINACESIDTGSSFGGDIGGRSLGDLYHRKERFKFNAVKWPLGISNLLILPPSHILETACLYHKFSIPGELVRREKLYHG